MATVDEDLSQLEKEIRQLKIEYEQYFGGGRKRPPAEIEWRIDLVIKRYGDRGASLNYGQRFRYSNLAQTYAKYKEIFHKRMRQREEGTVARHFGAAAKAIEAERAHIAPARSDPPAGAPRVEAPREEPGALFTVAWADPDREADKVELLYHAFREAKKDAGEDTAQLRKDNFQDFVRRKTQQLKSQNACREVEYVVSVEGGQVHLKARVKQ